MGVPSPLPAPHQCLVWEDVVLVLGRLWDYEDEQPRQRGELLVSAELTSTPVMPPLD